MTTKIVHKTKYILLAALLTAYAAMLILYPEKYIAASLDGLKLWAVCVVPSLFPFMVICAVFTNTGIAYKASLPLAKIMKKLKLPAVSAAAFIMSAMSGYPAGSRILSEFYINGSIDSRGVKKLACLCSTTGPLFAIGAAGVNMFGDNIAGVKLFLAHIISVLAAGLAFSFFCKEGQSDSLPPVLKTDVVKESFYGSVAAILTAGAFIVFFYTAARAADDLNILFPLKQFISLFSGADLADAVCVGLIEMTGGCAAAAKTGDALALPFAGFMITFGGVCIIMQQLCYLIPAGVKPAVFILQKFLQGVLCFWILFFIG
ncbi:MAG: hypothetical protein LUD27_02205 [Clostridia bacterium]|nr:hypothetical protein [Clostridia bacterium]